MGHKVELYTLSTCIHCRKMKDFLRERDVEFSFVDVDMLSDAERQRVLAGMQKYDRNLAFPLLVIDDGKKTVLGFDPDAAVTALGL